VVVLFVGQTIVFVANREKRLGVGRRRKPIVRPTCIWRNWQAKLEGSSAMLNGVRDRLVSSNPSNLIAISVSIIIIVVIVAGPA
jgi:hypothetical protein